LRRACYLLFNRANEMASQRQLPPNDWQIWQIVDSAFPTGGFAHSGGLESAFQHGWVRSPEELCEFVRAAVSQAYWAGAPFVAAAHADVDAFAQVDRACDALLSNHVANRASRVQGAAFLSTAAHTFEIPALAALRAALRAEGRPGHLAPCFGTACAAVGLHCTAAVSLFQFHTLRGLVSAAVRLGILGSLDAQRMQQRLAAEFNSLAESEPPAMHAAAQTSPILEILHARHERLYSRLFVS
jgi:urease accessory protein